MRNFKHSRHLRSIFSLIKFQILFSLFSTRHNVLSAAVSPDNVGGALPAIVVFGDSLSDTGNVFNKSQCFVPTPDVYWHGRFSNGPVWVDHLAHIAARHKSAGPLIVQNYAHGGATACSSGGLARTVPNLSEQILSYISSKACATAANGTTLAATTAASRACMPLQPVPPSVAVNACSRTCEPGGRLFIVFIGHNDLAGLKPEQMTDPQILQQTTANVTACRVAALEKLVAALAKAPPVTASAAAAAADPADLRRAASEGAGSGVGRRGRACPCIDRDRVLVWNLAPLDDAPLVPNDARPFLKAAIAAHNAGLKASLVPLQQQYPHGPTLEVYDIQAKTASFMLKLSEGEPDTTIQCLRTRTDSGTVLDRATLVATTAKPTDKCNEPGRYTSYDGLHPTSRIHRRALAEPFATFLGWL